MTTEPGGTKSASFSSKLVAELKTVGMMMLYFACWLIPLLVVKNLLLEEYHVPMTKLSTAVIGALVLSKVVAVLEHVSLGGLTDNRPAWLDVLLRTLLYAVGVAVVLLVEKAFEARHEHDGFWPALTSVLEHRDINHIWTNVICLSAALLSYNILAVIRRHVGEDGLLALLRRPLTHSA